MMSTREPATPGGPGLSDAKRRRLAALEVTLASFGRPQKGPAEKKRPIGSAPAAAQKPKKRRRGGGAAAADKAQLVPQQEAEAACLPPYDPLCASLRESILSRTPQQGGAHAQRDVLRALLEDLTLTNPKTASARAVLGLRVQDKSILLDNPAAPVKSPLHRQSGLVSRLLSGARRKQLGIEQLRPEEMKYSLLLPLHQLWQKYARDVLRCGQKEQLMQLDLHGCLLRVVQHRDAHLVGQQGIVVRYSGAAFHLVSGADRLQRVPRLQDSEVQFRVSDSQVVSLKC